VRRALNQLDVVFGRTLRPLLAAARARGDRLLERRHGVQTFGEVGLTELELDAAGRADYKPAPWSALGRVLPKRDVGAGDVFIDFGAGKGRVVFLAAHYPFDRVIGVELSDELASVARANVERNRARLRCQNLEILTSDVLDYRIPDDVTVAFFNNPFTDDVFATVIHRLMASVDRRPRRLRVIYRNPVEHELLMSTGRVRLVRRSRGLRPTRRWARTNSTYLYEVLPGPPPPPVSSGAAPPRSG
jgi:SAM-dependent methyltransferase